MAEIMKKLTYEYKNCPVPGGGFVTGFLFHKKASDVLYCRTDIGGTYRYDFENNIWRSLIDHVCDDDSLECYPLSIALDDENADTLFIACGDGKSGRLCISYDRGHTFTYKPIPCSIHGNFPGRATGERLLYKNGVMWFASQSEGLLKSSDMGDSWEKVQVSGDHNMTLIWISDDNNTIIVGTNGGGDFDGKKRGHTLYISKNGKAFEKLTTPLAVADDRSAYHGFVPQRCTSDEKYLYITFAQSQNPAWGKENAYACDTGSLFDGRVVRYDLDTFTPCDITPNTDISDQNPDRRVFGGFSGIDTKGGILVASTVCSRPDEIYLSTDCGESWVCIMSGMKKGKIDFDSVSYMKPCYNGGGSLVHWMSDIKINPHNLDFMVMNTGTGVFCGNGLLKTAKTLCHENMLWQPFTQGIEETVHLNVYSLPSGDVKCIDIIGDLGGFAFCDLDKPCENSFADEKNDRYITCLNADFADCDPYYILATPRGNWTGKTKGGIILSKDQCKTWERLSYPYGITEKIDAICDNIQKPNVDSGWVALSCDKKRIIWAMSQMHSFISDCVVYSDDEGISWDKSTFFDENFSEISDSLKIQIYADRQNPQRFFAFGETDAFISTDKGKTFVKCKIKGDIPPGFLGFRRACEIRLEPNSSIIWAALGDRGLYRFEVEASCLVGKKITNEGDTSKGIGFGKPNEDSGFVTLFTSGRRGGVYGFWRSDDYGESWILISDENQHFGTVISIAGDMREHSRFYIATGSRGLIYGQEK